AAETYRTISTAIGMAGLGSLTLSRRERIVLVEPRGQGLALITLRAAEEVRAAEFDGFEGELDAEAVAIAGMIIQRKTGSFDLFIFRDRHQEALRELIVKGAARQSASRGAARTRVRSHGRPKTK